MPERRRTNRFDKVFPVYLSGERGMARGVARNISSGGMFIETAGAFPLGSHVVITFTTAEGSAEIVAQAEVRYQCALEYGAPGGAIRQLRGIGIRFLSFETSQPERAGLQVLH
jgi:Tfp pilus assembly protein PilZ